MEMGTEGFPLILAGNNYKIKLVKYYVIIKLNTEYTYEFTPI